MIRVRQSGLAVFAVRIASIFTGLVFVVLVTSNISPAQFALWNLISRTMLYVMVPNTIISFWATRARARGSLIARTVVYSSLALSALLVGAYVCASLPSAGILTAVSTQHSNLFYFLLSAPQVVLYCLVGGIEGILWGYSPVRRSSGFAVFEVVKVVIGLIALAYFHLGLEGAILAVIGAQIVQLIVILFYVRREFQRPISITTLRMWFKSGWLVVLQDLHPVILGLDFVIVAIFIRSSLTPLLLDYFATATIVTSVVGGVGVIAYGLYPSVLSGEDPAKRTSDVLELELMILGPMLVGVTVVGERSLYLFQPVYTPANIVILPLAISFGFYSLRFLLEGVIMGSERADIDEKMTFRSYIRSKLFLVSKIDLVTASGYLLAVVIFSILLANDISGSFFGLSGLLLITLVWGLAYLGRSIFTFLLKLKYTLSITKISIAFETILAIVISSAIFGIILWQLNQLSFFEPVGGKIHQALVILAMGVISLLSYGGALYALSSSARRLLKSVLVSIF